MKKLYIVLFAIILGISFNTNAQTFSVVNGDGDTIYYGIISSVAPYKVEVRAHPNKYSGDITIPSSILYNGINYSVTKIGAGAFYYNPNLTSINLPTSITNIGNVAFTRCSALTKFTIPENITQIGTGVFSDCTILDTLYFNATNCSDLANYIFLSCDSLNTIIIGNNVTRIPNNAFFNCNYVTSINIPSSVNFIGASAFKNCVRLNNINIPSSVTSLQSNVFRNCDSLSRINIPSSVTSIGEYAFADNENLDSVIIPSSVTSLGSYVFASCKGLSNISIPNSIISLPDYTFQNCISLTSLNLPYVTSLGIGVFSGCTSLTSYTLPNNITNIPDNTFLGCTSLASIIIPPNVTNIKINAFKNCTSLSNIDLPNNISIIETSAFDGCNSLSRLNIPSTLGTIGNFAFRNCSNFDTIIINRITPPTIFLSTFFNVPNNIPIILPCSSQLNYQTANYWSRFTSYKELDSCLYAINIQSIDSTMGTVTGSGTYSFDTITITATPFQGNYFAGWNDGDTNSIRTVIVTKDSTFTAIFKQVVYSNINDTICQGQTYSFFGNSLTTEGLFSHTIAVSQTKDSIINLQLEVNPTYTINIYDTICESETYTQNGFNVDTSGIYTNSLQTIKGCDSIINLYLYVNQSPTTNIQASICQGQTYSLNGFNADTAGTYTLNLQTYKGCDSTVNLSLLVNPTYTIDIQGEVCQGKFYYQNGFFEHMPGIHTRHLQTTEGCDSIVNLHLTVNPSFSDTIFAQICQGEVYSENGFNADSTGVYTLNFQSINGCDSIICLNLIVNEIATPTNLTLNNIANYIELSWEGVGENYVIYRNNDSLSMTSIRIYQDSNVVEGVNYCYMIKALNGYCESDFSNEECKTFLGINTIETNNFNAYLYPNPTNDKTILRVEDLKENALVRIYDLTGRLIKTLEINANDKELEIDVQNFTKGVYNIRICNSTINITKKLIVN